MKKMILALTLIISGTSHAKTFIDYCKGNSEVTKDQAETVAMLKLALLPKAPWPVRIPTPAIYDANGDISREADALQLPGYAVPTTTKFNYKFASNTEVSKYLKSVFENKSDCDKMSAKFEKMEALQLMSGTFALKDGSFSRYQLKDITPLEGALNLKYVILNQNNISDASVLGKLKNLKYIKITKNDLSNIEFVKELPNLISLDISENSVLDLSPLREVPQLEEFWAHTQRPSVKEVIGPGFGIKKLSDISALEGLTKLYVLSLGNNNIVDISALSNLERLNVLSLKNNNVKDITALKNLLALRNLYLSANKIEDASLFLDLENLKILTATRNKIKNCEVFKKLKGFKKLEYHRNPCK